MLLSTADDCVVVVVVVNATADDGAGSPKDRPDEVVVAAGAKEGVVDETAIGFIPKLNEGAELVGAGNVKPVVEAAVAGFVVDVKEKADPGANEPTVDCGSFGAKLVTVLGIAAVGFGVNKPVAVDAAGVVTPNPLKEGVDVANVDEPLKNPPNADGVVVLATGVDWADKPKPVVVVAAAAAAGGCPKENPPDGAGEAPNENPPAIGFLIIFLKFYFKWF